MTVPTVPSAHFDAVRGAVHATVAIAAPPEWVFRALTDPRELATWWGLGGYLPLP